MGGNRRQPTGSDVFGDRRESLHHNEESAVLPVQVLCHDEIARHKFQRSRRIGRTRFEQQVGLEEFDVTASPKLPAAQIRDLAALRWRPAGSPLRRGRNRQSAYNAQGFGRLAIRLDEVPVPHCRQCRAAGCEPGSVKVPVFTSCGFGAGPTWIVGNDRAVVDTGHRGHPSRIGLVSASIGGDRGFGSVDRDRSDDAYATDVGGGQGGEFESGVVVEFCGEGR